MNKLALLALVGVAGTASADLLITEVYAGVTGEHGTEDWFEVTWTGAGAFDTGGLFYDDESADPTVNAAMSSFILNTGESAVFLIDAGAAEVLTFGTIWGTTDNVGFTTGGGGLSQNGDGVFLFDGNTAGANQIASVAYGSFSGTATLEFDALGNSQLSQVGVNGAFASSVFFNDNIGGANNEIFLIGSPGAIPAPGAVALLGVGGIVAGRRRR